MICNKDTAKKTAKLLLSINAIKLRPKQPFTWASGWQSPIYCDNRIILSYPKIRKFVKESFAEMIRTNFPDVEVIAGVATGAIAIGVLTAAELDLPFIYIRPTPKTHGRNNQIEGNLLPEQKVLVIEDLISTGMSSMSAIEVLLNKGAQLLGICAIFTYNFQQSKELFKKAAIPVFTLSDYHILLAEAAAGGFISESDVKLLKQWRENPSEWKRKLK